MSSPTAGFTALISPPLATKMARGTGHTPSWSWMAPEVHPRGGLPEKHVRVQTMG